MTQPFIFSVHGTPRPQPRPRFVKGRVVSTGNDKARLWRDAVERACREAVRNRAASPLLPSLPPAPLFLGAMKVMIWINFAVPRTKLDLIGQPHTQRPDADNLAKLAMDVMERCRVFGNDSSVSELIVQKFWSRRGGLSVQIETASWSGYLEPGLRGFEKPLWLDSGLPE